MTSRSDEFDKPNQSEITKQVADAYNQDGRKYHEARKGSGLFFNEFLEVPATLSHLPADLNGKTVLDAGCGSGLYSTQLARRKARVFGMDLSETMIEIAKSEKPADLEISYRIGDICKTGLESSTFDLILSTYVLENVTDLSLVFTEFSRLLKPEGTLLFSVSHPVRSMANRENQDGKEVWVVDHYFSGGTRVSDLGNGLRVPKIKYTFSEYLNAATQAGFIFQEISEPKPISSGIEKDPTLYELGLRLPQLLILKFRKS